MTTPILAVTPDRTPASIDGASIARAGRPAAPPKEASREIKEAAAAFEAILVRQMLASSSVAGKGNYAEMGVEALATAITAGGGLGLGHAIEQAIGRAHPAPTDPGVRPEKTPDF